MLGTRTLCEMFIYRRNEMLFTHAMKFFSLYFQAKGRGILPLYLTWAPCLSFLEVRALEFTVPLFIYSCCSPLAHLTQSSPTKYQVPEMDRDRQQARFGLSLQRSAAGELMWRKDMVTQVPFHWSKAGVKPSVVCTFLETSGFPLSRLFPRGVTIFCYCAFL